MNVLEFFGRKELKAGARFLGMFAVFLLAFVLLFQLLPLAEIEVFVAGQALFILKTNGLEGVVQGGNPAMILLSTGHIISISFLCTGLLEIGVLAAAILASSGISWGKRIAGVFVAAFFAHAFNLARIVTTVFAAIEQPPHIAELAHDVLFRATLFIVVFVIYFAWFAFATGKLQQKLGKRINTRKE